MRSAFGIPSDDGEGAGTNDGTKGRLDCFRVGTTNGVIGAPVDNNLTEKTYQMNRCIIANIHSGMNYCTKEEITEVSKDIPIEFSK